MSEDDDLPRLLSGRYRLEEPLGHGGMGVVYRGVDLMMKREIAVKLIRAIDGVALDDDVAGRFLREAKNTARVQHPHIVKVFDLGRTDEGGLYFVMELLDGESLSARLRREGALEPVEAVHIGRQICEALQIAHTAGVIHRDLKPANIMLLTRGGDDNFVKVLDFGVSKSYSSDQQTQLTHTGMLVGTVDYMAPEQIMSKPVDGRTDIYSLGIVLYRMLAGKPPFKDSGVPALIHAHLNLMPKPLIEVTRAVPNDLDRVVLRCLAKNPDRRYESMAELSRALVDAMPEARGAEIPVEHERPPVARPKPYDAEEDQPTVTRLPDAPPPAPPDEPEPDETGSFEDATVKMDRRLGFKKPTTPRKALPMTPRGAGGTNPSREAWTRPEDGSNTRGSIPAGHSRIERAEPRTCAMCQTVNASYAQACVACGVSLSPEEQDAVRARVRAVPRTSSAPPMPLPSSPPLPPVPPMSPGPRNSSAPPPPMPQNPNAYEPPRGSNPPPMMADPNTGPFQIIPRGVHQTTGPHSPMHGVPAMQWLPNPQAPPEPPPSIWRRFLTWTGLRR